MSLRSMPSRATGAPPNPNELLMAVYGSSLGESNGAVEGHSAHRARMSVVGYKQTLAGLKTTSASPPGADLSGGVAEGPFLTHNGHW